MLHSTAVVVYMYFFPLHISKVLWYEHICERTHDLRANRAFIHQWNELYLDDFVRFVSDT